MKEEREASNTNSGLLALNRWLEQIGLTPITGWRMRQKGWFKTVNISGRHYVTQEEITRFNKRAAAGEFSKTHKAAGAPNCVAKA